MHKLFSYSKGIVIEQNRSICKEHAFYTMRFTGKKKCVYFFKLYFAVLLATSDKAVQLQLSW